MLEIIKTAYDPWLSSIIDKKTYRLEINNENSPGLNSETDLRMHKLFQEKNIFIYTKIPCTAIETILFLERNSFRLVDTNLIFSKKVLSNNMQIPNCKLRFAEPGDLEKVSFIAESSFSFSRFHLDPLIPDNIANKIKSEWVSNYFYGRRGDYLVIAEIDNNIAGFLLLLKGSSNELIIDLIATGHEYRGKGIAKEMIRFTESRLSSCQIIEVGTQLANVTSIGLYESLGFRLKKANYVFHYHN